MPPAAAELITAEILQDVLRLARSVSRKTGYAVDADELFSIGEFALVLAAERWDPARGVPFLFMAMPRVRGAMLDHLRAVDPMSRYGRTKLKALEEALGAAEPTAAERRVLAMRRTVLSLDALESPPEMLAVLETSNGTGVPEVHRYDQALALTAVLRLNALEQFVVWQTSVFGTTDDAVGSFLGLTGSRVQQIRKAAVVRLRALFLKLNASQSDLARAKTPKSAVL